MEKGLRVRIDSAASFPMKDAHSNHYTHPPLARKTTLFIVLVRNEPGLDE